MLTLRNHLCRLAKPLYVQFSCDGWGPEMEEVKIQWLVYYVVEMQLQVVARELLILEEFCVFRLHTARRQLSGNRGPIREALSPCIGER